MFYLVDKTEDLSLDTASQITLRDCSKEARGGARIYRSFSSKDQVVGTSSDHC